MYAWTFLRDYFCKQDVPCTLTRAEDNSNSNNSNSLLTRTKFLFPWSKFHWNLPHNLNSLLTCTGFCFPSEFGLLRSIAFTFIKKLQMWKWLSQAGQPTSFGITHCRSWFWACIAIHRLIQYRRCFTIIYYLSLVFLWCLYLPTLCFFSLPFLRSHFQIFLTGSQF